MMILNSFWGGAGIAPPVYLNEMAFGYSDNTVGAGKPHFLVNNVSTWSVSKSNNNGITLDIAYNQQGTMCARAITTTPYLEVMNTTDYAFIATPDTSHTTPTGITFSPDGTLMAVRYSASPFLLIFNTTTWTSFIPTGITRAIDSFEFNASGEYFHTSFSTAPYMQFHKVSDWSTFTLAGFVSGSFKYGKFNAAGTKYVCVTALTNIKSYNTTVFPWVNDSNVIASMTAGDMVFNSTDTVAAVWNLSYPDRIFLFHAPSWTEGHYISVSGNYAGTKIRFSPDGTKVIIYSTNTVSQAWVYNISVVGTAVTVTPMTHSNATWNAITNINNISFVEATNQIVILNRTAPYIHTFNVSDLSNASVQPAAMDWAFKVIASKPVL